TQNTWREEYKSRVTRMGRLNLFYSRDRNRFNMDELKNYAKEYNVPMINDRKVLYDRIIEALYQYFLNLDYNTIYEACKKYDFIYENGPCSDDYFWQDKLKHDFGDYVKSHDTWCESYEHRVTPETE